MPAVRMTPPKEVLIPTVQHIGAPATPVVKVGDEVKVGQLIAESSAYVSSPIYASVSGKVLKIEDYLRPDGRTVLAIRIESDGLMTLAEDITPPEVSDLDSFINAVRASGVVGLGGAGFPTSVKLDAVKKGEIKTIVINGAECEPYLTSDTRTMLDESNYIFEGISLLEKYIPSVEKFIFGIEKNKPLCIEEIARIFKDNSKVSILPLPTLYPQGAEKVIVYNTTGLVIPEGKLPADVGVLVINVTSLSALSKYIKTGMPLVERCVTFDGSAVAEPKNVIAPIGTSIRELADFAGGFSCEVGKVLYGGPMMGIPVSNLDEPITKTTGGITALNVKDSEERDATACIHCGRCVEACPLSLNPTAYSKALALDNTEEKMARLEEYRVNLCMECGCCSFVCPANRPLVQNNRLGKSALREYKAHRANLK
jgi:electron transport complex protein RnfC